MAAPHTLRKEEPNTGLTPFIFAASCMKGDGASGSLDLVYNLLRGAPDLIELPSLSSTLSLKVDEKKHLSSYDIFAESKPRSAKRRKLN